MARVYLGDVPAGIALAAEGTGGVVWSRVLSDAAMVDVLCDPDGRVPVPLQGVDIRLPVIRDDTALFAGRDVILGHCNIETAETLCDWMLWHRRRHRMTGALIMMRGKAGTAVHTATALSDLLQDDAEAAAELADCQIVIVDCDSPLGDAAKGHEAHPMNAPDAPGKDRMDPPPPDPWHAPLGYKLLFDMIRHRFLARATTVANLEVIDLVAPGPTGETMFHQATQAPMGIVALRGTRVYPWSLRKNTQAGFADHICKRFDAGSSPWRWCVALDRLPDGAIWMRERVLGAKSAAQAMGFDRFMALRYGRLDNSNIGQIVPKTSLVEDPALLARAQATGADPMRPPKDLPAEARIDDSGAPLGDRIAIVTTMKNEGPFILEWIAYHRAIGIRDFLIYTNDCTDGTDTFLQLLAAKGLCQWRENPYRGMDMKPQHAALDAANSEDVVKTADWAICMDVDEYIAIHTGDGTMRALFDAIGDANLISLTWRLFGNNDIDAYRDGFITQDFTRCAREFANKPHQAWGFKTLYRNIGLFRKMGVHRPKGLLPTAVDRINWVNGSGEPMPRKEWRTAWRSHSGTYGYDLVSLNHYAVRSAESFLVKRDRGRVNHVDRDQGMAYWFRMNHNVVQDRRMERMLPALQAEYDSLMSDPDIRAAHDACVLAHKGKIAELKQQPKYQEFHAELTSARLRKLSTLHGHFGSNVYLAGPQVIPDDVVDQAPDDEFFFTVDTVDETQH